MQQQKQGHQRMPSSLGSQTSLKSLDRSTFQYYRFLYQSQNHMLVRTTRFFGRKSFQWFRLTDTDLLLYSKKTSISPKATVPLETITFSDTEPILKGYTSCMKLEIPKSSVYWLHFKNENEKCFFMNLFAKEEKHPPAIPIRLNNQTFNPKDYQQYMADHEQEDDHRDLAKKEEMKEPNHFHKRSLGVQSYFRRESVDEENIITEIAQEGFIHVNQLKVYSDIYIRPRMTNVKENALKSSCPNYKNLSIQYPSIEVSKSEYIPNMPNPESNAIYIKDSSTLQFPLPTPLSYSTKETQSRHSFKKISFSAEKGEETRLNAAEKSGHQLSATGMPVFFVDTSVAGEDGDEVVQDILAKGSENVNEIRTMEFNGIVKRKPPLSPSSRDGSYYKNCMFTEERKEESNFQEDRTPLSKMSSSRKREKVIGPRVMMNSVGPTIDKHEEDQEVECGSGKDELKDKEVLLKFFSGEVNKKIGEFEDRSHLSLSVIDPRAEMEVQTAKKTQSVEGCIELGHKLIWNFELEKARECLMLYQEKEPLVELLIIESSILEIALSGSESKIRRTLERLQEMLNKMNNVNVSQKEPEKYFSTELNKAEIYIKRGAMHFFLGNKFQTVRAFAEGWRHYRKLEHLVEKKSFKEGLSVRSLHRFRFGHGCFNLIFSLIPPGLLKFMRLIGIMNPSKEKGLESLEKCRNENEIRSNYAAIALALYVIEFDVALERACDIVKDSLTLYGKCPLFHWIASIICWKFAQAKDACFMIKTALWQLKHNPEDAVYLIYELGWYHFVNMSWDKSLAIFSKVIVNALPLKFFKQQVADATALAKSLKLPLVIDFSNFQDNLEGLQEEKKCILPHLPHIAVKIAVCNFYLGHYELAIKWLLSAIMIYRNYSNFKSRQEEDFSKLALKFLNRCSMKMLAYEVIYLMRYLPKMPDQNLFAMLEQVETYQTSLSITQAQLEVYLATNSKEDPFIVEYFSATMIRIVNYCLLGDTDVACEIYRNHSKFLSLIPEDFGYLIVHIEYWIGRALISENRSEEAKNMLKALLRRKKCDFSINTRIRRVLAEIN